MWNLQAPPGFQLLRLDKPLTVYQRHLPHWRQDGATYFVTYRLADSLPQSKLEELTALKADWERRHASRGTAPLSRPGSTAQESRPGSTAQESRPGSTAQESRPTNPDAGLQELARQLQERIERWLDQGMGSCQLKQASFAAFLTSAMHHFDNDRYELDCYIVMPNHAHAIVRPLVPEAHTLEEIVGSWKKYSSRRINRALGQTGEMWQEESYDRIIRDEEHLWRTIQYIGSNPDRAGLPRSSCPLWIRPQWHDLGWRFERREPGQVGEPVRTAQESRPTREHGS
jgi:putative transposase